MASDYSWSTRGSPDSISGMEKMIIYIGIICLLVASRLQGIGIKMIWWFLYPIRGTFQPPKLDPHHPIRHGFTKCGVFAARHPTLTLMISIFVAASLCIPFPFLYTNDFLSGASNLPHHVWTSAQPYDGDANKTPDVVMRIIWVHGSYMKALEKDVLELALEIQDELLGSTVNFNPRRALPQRETADPTQDLTIDTRDSFHAINGLTNSSWFFHSPLQYWSCSLDKIHGDQDIITTVNNAAKQSTSVNVTLRHSIVFSGKRFEDHRLVAADSLVITLVHMLDSPVGAQWERKANELLSRNSTKWTTYDDGAPASTLYHFQFRPLSVTEHFHLALAYLLMCWYFYTQLWKLHALKSRLGLVSTVMMQLVFSTTASFVICAIYKIDLSKLPREAYPLVIVPIGLGDIFDFINAVLATSPRWSPSHRIGEAIGIQGPMVLSTTVQYLIFLWVLPHVTGSYYSSPVTAFCKFASIAIVLNFFFLMTLLVPVISVDIQRTELNDSLIHASNQKPQDGEAQPRKSWAYAMLLFGKGIPISTRIAGQIVLIGCVVIFQWHFQDVKLAMARTFSFIRSQTPPPPVKSPASLLSVDINQARTPTAWLRLQDHETARELIKVIKPNAHSYIARVYKPITFILAGADRTPNQFGIRPLLPAAYDFARNHMKLFVLTVIISVSAVAVFMNYLLWDELPESDVEDSHEDEPLLSIITLDKGHELDIRHLAASKDGIVATVGLDRRIQIWDLRKDGSSYMVRDFDDPKIDPFPILAICIDNDSNWLAFLSAKHKVWLWNIPERRWGPSMSVDIGTSKPSAFFFGYNEESLIDPVLIVRQNGLMSEVEVGSGVTNDLQICRTPLVSVRRHYEKSSSCSLRPRIITSSKKGCVHVASGEPRGWSSASLDIVKPVDDPDILSVIPLPALCSFLAVRKHTVDLVHIATHDVPPKVTFTVTHTFTTKPMKEGSLRCFHSSRRRPQCGSVGLSNFALAYTCLESGNCIMQSYLPKREGDTICFRDPFTPGSKSCCLWRETVESRYEVENPGKWEALQVGYIVGIRQHVAPSSDIPDTHSDGADKGLRRRNKQPRKPDIRRPEDLYEAWSLSSRGEESSCALFSKHEGDHLFNSTLGEIAKVGNRSVAITFGSVVKVILVGHEKFEGGDSEGEDDAFVGMTKVPARRRRFGFGRHKKSG